jgi:thioredoxin reductase
MSTKGQRVDVAIVGATITGILTALALRKRGASVAIFDHFLDNAALESILEVPPTALNGEGVTGVTFADLARHSIASVGVDSGGVAVRVRLLASGNTEIVNSDDHCVLASSLLYSPFGVEAGVPWVPNIDALIGKGVSKDAWSDAAFFEGQVVAVIGGGRRAAEQALIAAAAGAKPRLICPQKRLDDLGLRKRLLEAAVSIEEGVNVSGVMVDGAGSLKETTLIDRTGRIITTPIRALFLAQGLVCDWSIFEGAEGREPIHPALIKAGLAGGVEYWNYQAQIQQVASIERQLIE